MKSTILFALLILSVGTPMLLLDAQPAAVDVESHAQAEGIKNLPTRSPTATPSTGAQDVKGAKIILDLSDSSWSSGDVVTIVQWQDKSGKWHDVEGWTGHVQQNGQVEWWVGRELFDAGPFRWIGKNLAGQQLFRSDTFMLPSQNSDQLMISPN